MSGSTIISRQADGKHRLSRLTFCRDALGIGAPAINTDVGFTFDSISRVLEEQQTYNGLQFVTHNAWTSYPCTGFTFPSGRKLTVGFDAMYRKNAINEVSPSGSIAAWQFFGGRIATATLGNGMITSFMNDAQTRSAIQLGQTTPAWGDVTTDHLGYDGSGRLIGKRHWMPGGGTSPTTLVGFTSAYDPSSNKLFERALHAEDRSSLYANDSMDRLTGYKRGTLATGGTGISTPTTLPGIDVQRSYALDGLGNWLNTNYQPEGGSAQLEVRTHNKLNQLLAFGVAPARAPVLYDHGNNTAPNASRGNGNVASYGTNAFIYDALNRIRLATDTGTSSSGAYAYDALGRRVYLQRELSGLPAWTGAYIYDGQQIVEEIPEYSTTSMQYVWGQYVDELIQLNAVQPAGPNSLTGKYYLLSDLLYRSAALADSSGTPQIVETYDTDAYGETLLFSAAGTGGNWFADDATQVGYSACRFVFTGREYDPETGNYFYRARYYGPALGRFLGRDRADYLDGANLYGYVRAAPSRYLDPNGLNCLDIEKCFANCITFFLRCIDCEDVSGVNGETGRTACKSTLATCLQSCHDQGRMNNPVCLGKCPPPKPPPPPPPPAKPKQGEGVASTIGPHLAVTVGEQVAAATAEGGGTLIGPAGTAVGGAEAAPDLASLYIDTAAKAYYIQQPPSTNFACDVEYVRLLAITVPVAELPTLVSGLNLGKVPSPNAG